MSDVDFYEAVRQRGDLEPDGAREATLATLSTLGDHLADSVVDDLADSLPDEASGAFADAAADPPSSFGYEKFLTRVADRLNVDEGVAERRARAVGAALAETTDDAVLDDARAQLPDAFDRLFWAPAADELLETVESRGDLSSRDEAREATTAVLATLGERITPGEAEAVAAYLPDEFATALAPTEDVPTGGSGVGPADADDPDTDSVAADYDVSEFVDAVAEREGADPDVAADHVGAVSDALVEAVPAREFVDVLEQLPDEYGAVL